MLQAWRQRDLGGMAQAQEVWLGLLLAPLSRRLVAVRAACLLLVPLSCRRRLAAARAARGLSFRRCTAGNSIQESGG